MSYSKRYFSNHIKAASYALVIISFAVTVMTAFIERSDARRQQGKRVSAAEMEVARQDSQLAAKRREIETMMRDARYLLTRAAIFDPLEKEPETASIGGARLETTSFQAATSRLKELSVKQAAAGRQGEASGYFIIQYRGAIQLEQRRARPQ